MQSAAFPPDYIKRLQAPEVEVPWTIATNIVLARNADVSVDLATVSVYSTGVDLSLTVHRRTYRPGTRPDFDMYRGGKHQFLVGAAFSDGRATTNVQSWPPRPDVTDDDLILAGGGGGGSPKLMKHNYFLTPFPPDGELKVIFSWPDQNIEETILDLDGAAIRDAASRVIKLWEREPDPQPGEFLRAEPPPTQPGGWFDRVLKKPD